MNSEQPRSNVGRRPASVRHAWHLLCVLLCCGFAFGCKSKDRAELAPVSGEVRLDGKPLAKGTIVFESDGQRPATGKIENGQIVEVSTYEPNDGAPVGHHRVAIFATAEAASAVAPDPSQKSGLGKNYMGGGSILPKRYGDPKTSGLEADVEAHGGTFSFQLESK